MRASSLILALPALATAQQVPLVDQLKGWFNKASASISSALPTPPSSIPNPIAAGSAKVASLNVHRFTIDNYQSLLQPGAATASPGIEQWLVFVTGGNKTCFGLCARAEQAFNESAVLLAATPSPPNLGLLNCETDGPLCNAWAAAPPSIIHLQIPQPLPDQSTPSSTARSIPVNRTSVTAPQIAALHIEEKYQETKPYEGIFQPIDGFIAKNGLAKPVGYVIWGFSQVPSWAFMIAVSFISRNFMSRRVAAQTQGANAQAPGQAGAPPAAS